MSRPLRLDLPGVPQHVVQRAVDRRPCFLLDIHYPRFIALLGEYAGQFECDVHAYVLMCNHVHLLVTPHAPGGVGKLMHALSTRFVGFVNYTIGRSGPLWQGRYKSCLVGSDAYVLACYRYIELNPVRAGIVSKPGDYRWSSHATNSKGVRSPLLRPHSAYLALGDSQPARLAAYDKLLSRSEAEADEKIRALTRLHRAFGDQRFREDLERQHRRPMSPLKTGRPRKPVAGESESGA
jgi:putative transposase